MLHIPDDFTGHDLVATAFAAVPDGAPTLATTHAPEVVSSPDHRADVLVAGHTPGGQVRLPGSRITSWGSRTIGGPTR